jgi:tetratricopeptide (TPR) repeat protein
MRTIVFALILSLLPLPALAQTPAELREVGSNFGLSPKQVRRLFQLYDTQAAVANAWADTLRINRRTLRAAAIRLGATQPDITGEAFLGLIDGAAKQVREARDKIGELDSIVQRLDPGGTRSRALAVLANARKAFDEGRLDDAQKAFGALEDLRLSDLANVREAWKQSVLTRMQIAALGGNNEGASALSQRAQDQIDDWARHDKWTLALADADQWQKRGDLLGDNAALERSISIYRDKALPNADKETAPADWASTQNNLGVALWMLGERESGTARLEEAVTAHRLALEKTLRAEEPLNWAMSQNNLANTLRALGQRGIGTAGLEEAVAAFKLALEEQTRVRAPLDWAMTQNNLGATLFTIGERKGGTEQIEEAVVAFRLSLEERTREGMPLVWAETQTNLGSAFVLLGQREGSTERLAEGVTAYRLALEELKIDKVPLRWATAQNNLGVALRMLGEQERSTDRLEEAVSAFRLALKERTRERVPLDWAATQYNLGTALKPLGERESGTVRLQDAVTAYRLALEEMTRDGAPFHWAMAQNGLGDALLALAVKENKPDRLTEALTAYRLAMEEIKQDRFPVDSQIIRNKIAAIKALLAPSE